MIENAVRLTEKLIQLDTRNPPGSEHECARYLGTLLGQAGFNVTFHEFAPGRTSVVARLGPGALPICFTGHIDTVPFGSQAWTVDALGGDIDSGKIYGRGSSDMKSGVAALVVTALRLAEAWPQETSLVLVITAGEETGCEGARTLIEESNCLGHAGAIVVGEPTSNYPLVGHKGALWLSAKSRGVTSHGSTPELGVNAIYKAARMVCALQKFELTESAFSDLGAPTLNVGTINGGMNVNSVPDECCFDIDIRTVPPMRHDAVRDQMKAYLKPDLDELKTIVDLEGVWTSPQGDWVSDVFEVTADITGIRPDARGASYFTDASILGAYYKAPTIVLGPGEPDMAHRTNEYCYISRIEQSVEIYTAIAERWFGIANDIKRHADV